MRPAVVDQRAGVADADLLDRLPAAPAMQELARPVGEDMERSDPAVDPEAGFVDMQRRAFRQLGDGGMECSASCRRLT